MTIDKRKFEWNLNTLISAVTLVVMVGGWIYYWANTVRDIEELKDWQSGHEKTTSERRGQIEERIKVLEKSSAEGERKQDNMLYRVTVLESSSAQQEAQTQKLTEGLLEITGDLKYIRKAVEDLQAERKRSIR